MLSKIRSDVAVRKFWADAIDQLSGLEEELAELAGDFELELDVEPWVEYISWAWGWIKEEHALTNLGTVTPAGAGTVWGHRLLNPGIGNNRVQ